MEDKEAKKIIDKMAVRFDDGLWEVVEKALKSKDGSATFTVGGDSRDVSVFRAVFEDLSIEDVTMEKDRAAGLLNCRITVPDEWREVYRAKRDDVKKRRKGVDEEYDFLRAAARLYGVVSIEDLDEILKHWRKELFDEEPLYPANKELYFKCISERAERLMLIAGLRQYSPFASVYVADDCAVSYTKYPSGGGHLPQDAKNSVEERKGKERWYPATLDGFLLWSYEQHRDGGTEYEALKDFIYSRWKLDRDSEDDAFLVEDVLDAMYDTLAAGRGWKAAVNVMRETFEFSHLLEKDFVRLTQLLCNAANATRQDANWGFTPNELVARRGMGGTYDIETTPTDFARNPNVPTVKATVKVGRNDPCPCGSGKKFKKCCGAGK